MGRILLVGALVLGLLLSPLLASSALAALAVQEMPLNWNGVALELRADSGGNLWISDYSAGEIWQVNAAGTDSNVYPVGQNPGGPGDASPDNNDGVWWVDGTNLYRLNTSDNSTQLWAITNSTYLWGVGPVSATQVWMSDSSANNVYLFTTGTRNSCAYSLPDGGQGYYVAVTGSLLWIGDAVNGRLVRIDSSVTTDNLTWWPLPAGSVPWAVALDASGNVWYTDSGLYQLGRLALPNQLSVYPLPAGQVAPKMLAASGGKIWYSGQSPASIGALDPSQVSVTPQASQPTTLTVTPTCQTLKAPASGSVTPTSSTPTSWTNRSYSTLPAPAGWLVYGMPAGSQPNGIAITTSGFVVDSLRQVLGRFSTEPPPAHLTLVKNVTNNNSGTAVPADWTLTATGAKTYSGAGGFDLDIDPGTYALSESTGPTGYTASDWSCIKNGGAAVTGSSITLAPGDAATCTITNTYVPPGKPFRIFIPMLHRK